MMNFKNVNLIALDMDGVVNSDVLIKKYFTEKIAELEEENPYMEYSELGRMARIEFGKKFVNSTELIFPELANIITEIVEKTDSYIVWSSTWRKLKKYEDMESIKDMFNRHNLPGERIIGCTPSLAGIFGKRGEEIRSWLKNNKFFDYRDLHKCAVIDDLDYAGIGLPEKAKLFLINPTYGISSVEANIIIDWLNK